MRGSKNILDWLDEKMRIQKDNFEKKTQQNSDKVSASPEIV